MCVCVCEGQYKKVKKSQSPDIKSFINSPRQKHNTHLLIHSLHPRSPSFSLDAICPPWYADALPERHISAFFPSGPQLPPPCIFNGHTHAADKWFLFLTGEGWLQLHRDIERVSERAHTQVSMMKNAYTHNTKKESKECSNYLYAVFNAYRQPY